MPHGDIRCADVRGSAAVCRAGRSVLQQQSHDLVKPGLHSLMPTCFWCVAFSFDADSMPSHRTSSEGAVIHCVSLWAPPNTCLHVQIHSVEQKQNSPCQSCLLSLQHLAVRLPHMQVMAGTEEIAVATSMQHGCENLRLAFWRPMKSVTTTTSEPKMLLQNTGPYFLTLHQAPCMFTRRFEARDKDRRHCTPLRKPMT